MTSLSLSTSIHNGDWRRVSKAKPCPLCGKPDWCLVAADSSAVICPRTPDGATKHIIDAGYLHRMHDNGQGWSRPASRHVIRLDGHKPKRTDLDELAATYRAAVKPAALQSLADHLGLSVTGLQQLGIGFAGWAWTFPMTDTGGTVRGIRVRKLDGIKLAVTGSRDGLFIPADWDGKGQDGQVGRFSGGGVPLFINEGPTDTAALLDLGFNAVGRPSCTGGTRLLIDLIKTRRLASIVILADGDGPGQQGAETLASTLVAYAPAVRIITPPDGIKDARAWKRCGATRRDIQAAIDTAPVHRLSISIRKGK